MNTKVHGNINDDKQKQIKAAQRNERITLHPVILSYSELNK